MYRDRLRLLPSEYRRNKAYQEFVTGKRQPAKRALTGSARMTHHASEESCQPCSAIHEKHELVQSEGCLEHPIIYTFEKIGPPLYHRQEIELCDKLSGTQHGAFRKNSVAGNAGDGMVVEGVSTANTLVGCYCFSS